MGSAFKGLFIVMIVSFAIATFWNKVPIIKDTIHLILDPSAGHLLTWNATFGMILFSIIIALFLTLIQKYTTDQETLRELKKEQKLLQEEMKKYKEHPEKLMELQKKQFAIIPKTMEITMRPIMYTSIPIILFFRWFNDYFADFPTKILGMHWLLTYIIFSMIFTTIFRKVFNVA
ncbi:MAG: EMC3/TMCO1 family protein [archaeon]